MPDINGGNVMNRRSFLLGISAAAVSAALPVSPTETAEAIEVVEAKVIARWRLHYDPQNWVFAWCNEAGEPCNPGEARLAS